ncbi:hypothetical protein [Micromonospora sp. SL4-19]|uniref:hypothetical protein n=1 Tax=Micromonospora sp. SL4-19 TaxID=3399129 RepID=UPI003A4E4761
MPRPRLSGLEVWLTGTPAELDAAAAALTAAGHLAQPGTRHPLTGADSGRYRLYLRLTVATTTADRTHPLADTSNTEGAPPAPTADPPRRYP